MFGGVGGYMALGGKMIDCANYGFSSGGGIIGYNASGSENIENCRDEYEG